MTLELSDIWIGNDKPRSNHTLRSKGALKDALVYQLSSKTEIDWEKLLSQRKFEIEIDWNALQTSQKYYQRAEDVFYHINRGNPATPTVFVINTSDLTQSLRTELEQLQDIDPRGFDKVVTEAIQTLFEGINARYYHVAGLPYKVTWRFDP